MGATLLLTCIIKNFLRCAPYFYLTQSYTWKIVTIKIQMAIAIIMMRRMLKKDYRSVAKTLFKQHANGDIFSSAV